MYVPLNCVIIDSDATNRQELSIFLGRFGVNVVAQLPTADNLPGLLNRSDAPQLVIINLDPQTHEMLRRVGHLPRQFPSISFFLMSQVLEATLLMEAMHLGVREFIPLPMSEDKLTAAIVRGALGFGMGKKA